MDYVLSEADRAAIAELLNREKHRVRRVRSAQPEYPAVSCDVYVAYTPSGGIPALIQEAGTGTGENNDTPGSADCDVYELVNGTLQLLFSTVTVYNLSTSAQPGAAWILVVKDNGGTFWALSTDAPGVKSINGDTTPAQTLIVGTTGLDVSITNPGSGQHILHVPDASTTARGVVTTGDQYFKGTKVFTDGVPAGNELAVSYFQITIEGFEPGFGLFVVDIGYVNRLGVGSYINIGAEGYAINSSHDGGIQHYGVWDTFIDANGKVVTVSGGIITSIVTTTTTTSTSSTSTSTSTSSSTTTSTSSSTTTTTSTSTTAGGTVITPLGKAQNSGMTSLSYSIAPTATSLIVVRCNVINSVMQPSVKCNGVSMSLVASYDDATVGAYVFELVSGAGTQAVAVTAGGLGIHGAIMSDALGITGLPSNTDDQNSTNGDVSTTALTTGGTATTSASHEAVIAGFCVLDNSGFAGSWGGGFTSDGQDQTFLDTTLYGTLGGSKVISSAAPQTATFTLSSACGRYVGLVVTFK